MAGLHISHTAIDRPQLPTVICFLPMQKPNSPNAREAAFLATIHVSTQQGYAEEPLQQWRITHQPNSVDSALARQIAYGSIQMGAALDHLALQLTDKGSLKLKVKERLLLRTALYQAHYMERIPLYSIANESVRLAKKHCHRTFANFLNALLRAYASQKPSLPQGDDAASLACRYSYPEFYVEKLLLHFGPLTTKNLLEAGNTRPQTMVRLRLNAPLPPASTPLEGLRLPMARLTDLSRISELATSKHYYLQNVTSAHLMGSLAACTPPPRNILDLCAAPGGKTLAAADLYPEAHLVANEVSERRMALLKDNMAKYSLSATLTQERGETYPSNQLYDLIIVDAPCSNSGVLNKRPEARWRLNGMELDQLINLQMDLLRRAALLLSPQGSIWYMTCSILPEENEHIVERICNELPLKVGAYSTTIHPNQEGWDGGYGCQLVPATS